MNFLLHSLIFLVTILVLVTVHEFGHFIVAKWTGVRVLRFSIGFGRPLLRWYGKKSGTEYIVAWLPLGGYVKLLDEREGEVKPEDLAYSFNRKPLWIRTAVVIAGPGINLLFAILAFWIVFMVGTEQIKPFIGQVPTNSIAAQAGVPSHSQIISIDKHRTDTWQAIVMRIIRHLGNKDEMLVGTQTREGVTNVYTLPLVHWKIDSLNPDPLESLGLVPLQPPVPSIVYSVVPEGPAAKQGILPGDKILAINNRPITNWFDFIRFIQTHPQMKINLLVERNHKTLPMTVEIGRKLRRWRWVGYLGIESLPPKWPEGIKVFRQYSPLSAFLAANDQTWTFFEFNFILLGKMLTGKVSLQSLGGPIAIFRDAGMAFRQGVVAYTSFLGIISIMLAFVNILPIPGLDGGHLLFFGIEAVMRRPLSLALQLLIVRLGFIFLIVLILQATFNDLMRIF